MFDVSAEAAQERYRNKLFRCFEFLMVSGLYSYAPHDGLAEKKTEGCCSRMNS